MHADTLERYEAAKAAMTRQSHSTYVERVEDVLEKEEEWVLLFRTRRMAQGHSANTVSQTTTKVSGRAAPC